MVVSKGTLHSSLLRARVLATAMLGMAAVSAAPAMASVPDPATGTGPGTLDYGLLTGAFTTYVTPVLSQAMPYCIILMGLWMAPFLLKRLIHGFSH